MVNTCCCCFLSDESWQSNCLKQLYMNIEVTILGCSGATPAYGRHVSGQVVAVDHELFLVDCGEGTQYQLMRYGIKYNKIEHIFISHLHGDHIFGLPGFLTTLGLNNRTTPMHLYSPPGLEGLIRPLVGPYLPYELHFHESDPTQSTLLYESKQTKVHSIPLSHGVPCHGFLFGQQPKQPNLRKEVLKQYNIPYHLLPAIKAGGDYTTPEGEVLSHATLTYKAVPPQRYAYCSDTAYAPELVAFIAGVDLLYHEATFAKTELAQAQRTSHSIAEQAAKVAQAAGVKRLLLGHFSARYADLTPLLQEAKVYFEETELAEEGKCWRTDAL